MLLPTGTKFVRTGAVVMISLKVVSSCPALAYMTLRKRQFLFPGDSKWKEWKKIGNVSLESASLILEKFRRIQDPVQFSR